MGEEYKVVREGSNNTCIKVYIDLANAINSRQQLDIQLQENEGVAKVFLFKIFIYLGT